MKIEVDGVELTVTLTGSSIKVTRVIGRDRKRKINITSGKEFRYSDPIELLEKMKQVAKLQTARCQCDYQYGCSDHAEHCESIYKAHEYVDYDD